jgi:hypothetical protein
MMGVLKQTIDHMMISAWKQHPDALDIVELLIIPSIAFARKSGGSPP